MAKAKNCAANNKFWSGQKKMNFGRVNNMQRMENLRVADEKWKLLLSRGDSCITQQQQFQTKHYYKWLCLARKKSISIFYKYVTENVTAFCVLKCYFKLLFCADYMSKMSNICGIWSICVCVLCKSLYLCYTILSKIRCLYSNYILDCRVLVLYNIYKNFHFLALYMHFIFFCSYSFARWYVG